VLEILFENDVILAVNKPSGLLTQAPRGIESLESLVKSYLAGKSNCGGQDNENNERNDDENKNNGVVGIYLGIPHRLDRPVSGVILFGKTSRATRRISEQFENRQIDKTYWGIVEGNVDNNEGTWIDYIRKIPNRPIAEIVQPINPDAREAILHYKVLRKFIFADNPFTLLEIKLETGRMHQIRLQSSARGHSILGDATYGSTFPFGENFNDERCREIALHARSISFIDPISRELINLSAPTPPLWNMLEINF
jgi:RluA family pseudouridine synthase